MSFLTEQVGPLPGGAWLAVIGGGLAIGYLGRRKRTAANTAPVPADTAQWQSSQGAVQYVGPGTGVTSMGTPKPATNEEWAQQAVSVLIGMGTLASKATNAISHVLYPDSANPTSADDSALYNLASTRIGPPPILPSQAYIPDPPPIGTSTESKAETFSRWVQAGRLAGLDALTGRTAKSPGDYFFGTTDPDPTTTTPATLTTAEVAAAYQQGYTGSANDARAVLRLPPASY